MRNRIALFAILLAALAAAPNAMAQTVGIAPAPLAPDQVQDIAAFNGVVAIRKIELFDGTWKVEGLDRAGRRVEMKVHPITGEIMKLDRYD